MLVTRDEIRQGLNSAIFGFRFYIKTQWQGKLSNGILLTEFLSSLSPAKSLTIVEYSCFFTETTQATMRHHEFILHAVLKVGKSAFVLRTASSPPFSKTDPSSFPPHFQQTALSPSPWKATQSNLHPQFQNCLQNDVTTGLHSLGSFCKTTTAYYYITLNICSKFKMKVHFFNLAASDGFYYTKTVFQSTYRFFCQIYC